MVDTSLQDAGMSRVSPEMVFSHRVDIFWKTSYRKIISFKKVTAVLQKLKIVQKKVFFALNSKKFRRHVNASVHFSTQTTNQWGGARSDDA